MANWYSSNFGSGANVTTYPDPYAAVSAGVSHARLRHNICHVLQTDGGIAEADRVIFCTMNSGDRIVQIQITCDGNHAANMNLDMGFYVHNDNHDGAEVDHDIFGAGLDIGAGFALTDITIQGALTKEDIGKTLWEMTNIGDTSYTEDPVERWDLVGTIDTVGAGTGGEILVLVQYTSGA